LRSPMKEKSAYNPIALGDILEKEMGGMSRAAFARKLGITRPSLDKYLAAVKGGTAPSCEALCLMADNLGCSVDYLLGRTEARVPEKAIAADELGLTETIINILKHQKEADRLAYYLFAVFLTSPWFWDIMHVAQELVQLKAAADLDDEKSIYPSGFDIKRIDGHRVICYAGDSVRKSLLHYIATAFASGLDAITDSLFEICEDGTLEINYDKCLYKQNAAPAEKSKR